jgi:hypothetical protein
MKFKIVRIHFLLMIIMVSLNYTRTQAQTARDIVNGNLIQFNDNGFWCWFQDERAIVDVNVGKIVVGSSASGAGSGGSLRNGANDAVIFDFETGELQRYELARWSNNCDDHNAPAFLVRPDGKYIALYDQHYDNYVTRYRIFDGTEWAPEQTYDWRTKPGGIDYTLAYNNVYYLSEENRMYNFQRANHRSPNFLISSDLGNTWLWGGQLSTNTSNSYNKGYYKYWSNGLDRIDFVFTEQHPRDTLTSIYHGYIKGGKAYRSDGLQVDADIFDTTFIPAYWNFTKVFGDRTMMGTIKMRRCWQADMVRYSDGTIATIITARSNDSISTGYPDTNVKSEHSFIYCRYDGVSWSATYLGKAGQKLYSSEGDYTGLAALCPNDPSTIYISTTSDPRDTSINLGVHEIFKGVSSDNGASWAWTPITQNSVRDNLRPIVPAWDENNTALLWCRGTYTSAQSYDLVVVGIIERDETTGKKTYVDATIANTIFLSGNSLITTGPDTNAGATDGQWHLRTGWGNGGDVLTSAELVAGENTPTIKTRIDMPDDGQYDIWVNFWGNQIKTSDWRIKAGLSPDRMQVFRSMASKKVDSVDYNNSPMLSGTGNTYLYQAYLGRVSGVYFIDVIVDDSAYQVGTTSPLRGDVNRTWYDGVSYAKVGSADQVSELITKPQKFILNQNYPNPFNPETKIEYQIPNEGTKNAVTLRVYDLLGREVAVLVNEQKPAGRYEVKWDASKMASGIYFYRLKAGKYSNTKKMILIR